jgi:hypothetical protein
VSKISKTPPPRPKILDFFSPVVMSIMTVDQEDAILSSTGIVHGHFSQTMMFDVLQYAEEYYIDNPIMHQPTLVIYDKKSSKCHQQTQYHI